MRSKWWVEKGWKPLILGQLSYLADGENREETWVVSGDPANIGRATTNQGHVQSSSSPFQPISHSCLHPTQARGLHSRLFLSQCLSVCCNHPSQGSIPRLILWLRRPDYPAGGLTFLWDSLTLVPSPNAKSSLLCPRLPRRAMTVYYPNKLFLVCPVHGEDFWKGSPN